MKLLTASMIGLAALVASSAPAAAQASTCKKISPRAAAPIFHTIDTYGFHFLNRPKLDGLQHSDIQPLVEEPVCEALDAFYANSTYDKGGWHREYFKTGGYYMASIYYTGHAKQDVKTGHIAIFSGKLRLVSLVLAKL